MSQSCPDNSTECLLRVLIDLNSGYNWNPLNFAFTAAIGALALIIACVTVFQGLLAAGPGRLKASKAAIGPFSVNSKNRFDRTELALRTTAYVPFITWESILDLVTGNENAKARKLGEGVASKVNDTTATWLTLLRRLGLDDPRLFTLLPKATDYLPSDVQAAPAAGELKTLAILAAISDTNTSIDVTGRFLTVAGDKSQLVFRDHPNLGSVAAYETYSAPGEETNLLDLRLAGSYERWALSAGHLFYRGHPLIVTAYSRWTNAKMRIRSRPETGFNELIRDLSKRSKGCGHDLCAKFVHIWQQYDCKWTRGDLHEFLPALTTAVALMNSDSTTDCRAFPYTKLGIDGSTLGSVIKLSPLLIPDILSEPAPTMDTALQTLALGKISDDYATVMRFPQQSLISWVSTDPKKGPNLKTSGLGFKLPLEEARVWIYNLLVPQQPPQPANWETAHFVYPLQYLNAYLSGVAGPETSCVMLQMISEIIQEYGNSREYGSFSETVLSPRAMRMRETLHKVHVPPELHRDKGFEFIEDDGTSIKDPAGADVPHSDRVTAVKVSHQQAIRTLLAVRGAMCARNLMGGADTSLLFAPDWKDSIVTVL